MIEIALPGRPIAVELRWMWVPLPLFTPGRNVMKFMALRVTIGRFWICSDVTVAATVVDVVSTSAVNPVTLTVSVMSPTSSLMTTLDAPPGCRPIRSTLTDLKPVSDAVASYSPGSSAGTEKVPVLLEMVSMVTPVRTFLTTTVTPGRTAPLLSWMTPLSVAVVVLPWANAGASNSATSNSADSTAVLSAFMVGSLPVCGEPYRQRQRSVQSIRFISA